MTPIGGPNAGEEASAGTARPGAGESDRIDPAGGGEARGTGYGAGGLGSGGDRAGGLDDRDAPGVTPSGQRTGTSTGEPPPAEPRSVEPVSVGVALPGHGAAHLEPKSDGTVVARFTVPPEKLPRQMTDDRGEDASPDPETAVTDVAVLPDGPSVWEARKDER